MLQSALWGWSGVGHLNPNYLAPSYVSLWVLNLPGTALKDTGVDNIFKFLLAQKVGR